MDERNAIKLLDETFNTEFDLNRYSKFVKELFNVANIRIQDKTPYIANQYKEYISEFKKISEYKDSSRKKMEILTVKLNRTSSRDRARTMQRNFIANWLSKMDIDAALVAFYGEDPEDWRFSFVKMEYNLIRDEEGKVRIAKELTPAKRYSYLVGVNEPNHTCRRQFLDLVIEEDTNPEITDIEQVFSIDNVTKEFFKKYKELVIGLKESLERMVGKDTIVKREFDEKGITAIDFSKKLLGQIVFIYFLQKKGWLGIGKNKDGTFKEWGAGQKKFLRKLYDGDIVEYDNFFNDILEPLFYEALATEHDKDYYSRFNCKIPFLNGGLFEPINDYDWTETDILIDNSVFKEILDTFDRFNFTVKEDEPLEKEVAVDPEMLGKVFENLLDVKDRKSRGAFYTPREIVHYMCQQSLINYLETNTEIPIGDIEKFIQLGDFALDLMIKEQEQIREYGRSYDIDEKRILPKSIKENYLKIDRLLKDIKIVDPAVGSGAFPVGMMNEIVKARSVLTVFFNESEWKNRTNYNFKRETIENSLYGVDIDSSAVDIAKLRFWLSLIVDESDITDIQPLPNLDHKIMCGNSLLEEFEGVKLFDEELLGEIPKDNSFELEPVDREEQKLNQELHEIYTGKKENKGRSKEIKRELEKLKRKRKAIVAGPKEEVPQLTLDKAFQKRRRESQRKLKELKRLQKLFFNEQSRESKRRYRTEIGQIEWELIEETLKEEGNEEAMERLEQYKKNKSKPFFLWKLYFSDVFQRENPGFDVVIANPPYVEHKKLKQFSRIFQRTFSTYSGTADLYVYFYEKSYNLLKEKGSLAFITSNKFMKTSYGKNLRRFLSKNEISEIIDFTDIHVFEALVASCVLIGLKNSSPDNDVKITFIKDDYNFGYSLFGYIHKNGFMLPQKRLGEDIWKLESQEVLNLKEKIDQRGAKIRDVGDIGVYRGITTGFNPAFIIDKDLKNVLIKKNNSNENIIKPLLQGRNVKKWRYKQSTEFLIQTDYDKDIPHEFPSIYNHLKQYVSELIKRADQGKNWWNLRACKYHSEFEKNKIIWGLTADKWAFAYDPDGHYLPSNGYILTSKSISLKLILGQLNSNLLKFYFGIVGIMTAGGAFTLKHETIKSLPIIFNTKLDQEIVEMVDQILSITKDDGYPDNPEKQARVKELEKEIDKLVYKLYDLTPEEIDIVENFNKEK